MTVERRAMTAEALLRLPDDGTRRELIDGVLRTTSPTGAGHGEHGSAITFHVGTHPASHPVARLWGGEVGFVLRRNPDRVRAPDIAVMGRERVPPAGFFARVTVAFTPHHRVVGVSGRGAGPWERSGFVGQLAEEPGNPP
jgi:Uma2 family endonuclease